VRAQLRRWASWLSPGIGVKRWGVLMVLGVLLVSAGAALIVNVQLLGLVESVIFQVALSLLIVTRGLLSPTLFGAALILAGALVGFIGLRGVKFTGDLKTRPSFAGYELQIASVTALVLMVPGAILLLLLERVLKAEYLAFFGQL